MQKKKAKTVSAKNKSKLKNKSQFKALDHNKKKLAEKKTAKRSSSRNQLRLADNIWPLEKDILFRPDRLKYVRKLIQPEGCVFCLAAKAQAPNLETLCVYQTQHSMIILNKYPYNSGHLLVIPRRHCGDLTMLTDEEYTDLHLTLRLAVKALKVTYEPGGINIGLNHGAVAGAGIPDHLHYHVIPRWSGDLNFFPLIAETKTVIESLERTFDRLLLYIKQQK